MLTYRHRSDMIHPDLNGWEPRSESTVGMCHQLSDNWNYCAIVEPYLWNIPENADWKKLSGEWECAYTPSRGGIVPGRDLTRLQSWAIHALPSLDAKGASWIAPIILTQSGDRAFPVSYAGADFLPALTPEQIRVESVAKEARIALLSAKEKAESGDDDAGIPQAAACRWTAILLSVSHHLSPETIAATGVLDDVLIRRTLIIAAGLDRRMDG